MRRVVLSVFILCSFYSCKKETQPLTKVEMAQRIDSITRLRIEQSDAQARKDLEYRIEIEVRAKADSILNARLHPVKPAAAHPNHPLPPVPPGFPANRKVGNI